MDLYFAPFACSMATRISLYEAGAAARYLEVDSKAKRVLGDGSDFRAIHPLGLVPTLRTDEGELLTENAAILQWVADRFPDARLAPQDALGRTRLHQWLCFVGTELHKSLFTPLLDAKSPDGAKAYALEKGASRLAYVDAHLRGRTFLLDEFTVADAYLFTVMVWSTVTPVDRNAYPSLQSYVSRLRERPSIAKALAEERVLYAAELARAQA